MKSSHTPAASGFEPSRTEEAWPPDLAGIESSSQTHFPVYYYNVLPLLCRTSLESRRGCRVWCARVPVLPNKLHGPAIAAHSGPGARCKALHASRNHSRGKLPLSAVSTQSRHLCCSNSNSNTIKKQPHGIYIALTSAANETAKIPWVDFFLNRRHLPHCCHIA